MWVGVGKLLRLRLYRQGLLSGACAHFKWSLGLSTLIQVPSKLSVRGLCCPCLLATPS